MIKPIETQYRGCRFRSRLEARWAIFFDALGLRWEYEPEGFDLGPHGLYLPDFYCSTLEAYVEIKPDWPGMDEAAKYWALASATKTPLYLIWGSPWIECYQVGLFRPGEADDEWFDVSYTFREFTGCRRCDGLCLLETRQNRDAWCEIGRHTCGDHDRWPVRAEHNPRIMRAYNAARSARFEHGESGYAGGASER